MVWSIITWVIIFIAYTVSMGVFGLQIARAIVQERPPEELLGPFAAFLIASAVGTRAFGIPYLLITYQVQEDTGKRVLWAAFAVQAAVTVGVAWYQSSRLEYFLDVISRGGLFLGARLSPEALAGMTSLVWAYAYYLAYRRVAEGSLPPVHEGRPRA